MGESKKKQNYSTVLDHSLNAIFAWGHHTKPSLCDAR